MRPATLLSVLMFPQAWDGHRLRGSVLLLPTGDPLHAPLFDSGAPFAGMPLVLQLVLQPGAAAGGVARHRSQAEAQPAPHAAALAIEFAPSIDRAQARRLFEALHHQFLPIPQPSNPIALAQLRQRRGDRLRALGPVVKVLPPSYCAAAAIDVPQHAPQVIAEADYLQRLAEHAATTPAAAAASTATSAAATAAHSSPVSWGQVLSYALRQPALARALGLVVDFDTDFTGWDLPRLLAHGGWLHATLAASTAPSAADSAATFRLVGDAIAGDSVAPYAARLPPLSARARPLFAAVLFPVAHTGCEPQRVEQGEAGQLLEEEAMRGNGDQRTSCRDDDQRTLRCDDDQRTLRAEAARYDDGFARVVHAAQPLPPTAASDTLLRAADAPIPTAALPCIDGGIALGWDDEQVLRWVNRQLDSSRMAAPGGSERRSAALDNLTQPLHSRAPLGVAGYRVDVRSRGSSDAGWRSLCGVQGDVALAGWRCSYRGEFMVDTAPQLACRSASGVSTQWLHLPRYFAAWCAPSLVLADPAAQRLAVDGRGPGAWSPQPLPATRALPALRYGRRYDFRVRLVDLTGGGPQVGDVPQYAAAASVASVRFERWVPPKAMRIVCLLDGHGNEVAANVAAVDNADTADTAAASAHPTRVLLRRPLLAYPDFRFAGIDATPTLLDELARHRSAARTVGYGLGVPDPDATHLAVSVQVRTLRGDTEAASGCPRDGDFIELFSVLKPLPARDGFPATSLRFDDEETAFDLLLTYTDCADVRAAAADLKAASGGASVAVPTGRDVRLRLRAANLPPKGRRSHFAPALLRTVDGQRVAVGLVADIDLRSEEIDGAAMAQLFDPCADDHTVALWLPVPAVVPTALATAVAAPRGATDALADIDPVAQMADAFGLHSRGSTLHGAAGERVVFAATGRLAHTLTAADSEISFASHDALRGRWLVARRVRLQRDWSWCGTQPLRVGFEHLPAGAQVSAHDSAHDSAQGGLQPLEQPASPTTWPPAAQPRAQPNHVIQSTQITQIRLPTRIGHLHLDGQAAQATAEVQRDHTVVILFDAVEAAGMSEVHPAPSAFDAGSDHQSRPAVWPEPPDSPEPPSPQRLAWRARALLPLHSEVIGEAQLLHLPWARPPREAPHVLAMEVVDVGHRAGAEAGVWIEFAQALSVDCLHAHRGLKYFARWRVNAIGTAAGAAAGAAPGASLGSASAATTSSNPADAAEPASVCIVRPGPRGAQSADASQPHAVELLTALSPADGSADEPTDASNNEPTTAERPQHRQAHRWWLAWPPHTVPRADPFGTHTLELRIGYGADHWTMAAARFGPPLWVTGMVKPRVVAAVHLPTEP